MKTTKSMIASLALAMLTILGSCNASQQNEGEGHQKQQIDKKSEQVRTDKSEQQFDELKVEAQAMIKGSNSVGAQLPKNKVCMVNDAYMAKEQIAVPVQGKTTTAAAEIEVVRDMLTFDDLLAELKPTGYGLVREAA